MDVTTWHEAEEAFDEMLDEIYEPVEVAGLTFNPSRVLYNLDPIAYRCSLLDFLDSEGIDTDELED